MRYADHPYVNDLGDDDMAQVCVPEDAFEEALLKHAITHEMAGTPWVVSIMGPEDSQRLCRLRVVIGDHAGGGKFALTVEAPPEVEVLSIGDILKGEPTLCVRGWAQVLRNDMWRASPIRVAWGFEEQEPYILAGRGKQTNRCPYGPVLCVRPEDAERYGWKPEAEEGE